MIGGCIFILYKGKFGLGMRKFIEKLKIGS